MTDRATARTIVRHWLRNTTRIVIPTVGRVLICALLITGVFSYTRTHTPTRVYAATADTLNFQARIYNNSGTLVPDGNYSVQFKLYDALTGGTNVWTETQGTVTVKNGYFSVGLGSSNPFPGSIDWSQNLWLTMNVNADGEMSPRIKLTAVPYAFRANQAEALTNGAGTLTASQLAQLAPATPQAVSSALAALRINQTGTGLLAQLQGDSGDVFTISKTGQITIALDCSGDVNGGSLTTNASGVIICSDDDGGGGASNAFVQNGNSFGVPAVLGTTDGNGLSFITDSVARFTIDASGNANLVNGSLSTGGTVRLTNAGALQNITGLTVVSGGASITGGINNNSGGIMATGSIAGATTINASGRITTTGGITTTGAITNINANSNFATNINTGSSSGLITIGGGSAPLIINSTNFDVSSAGALSGITSINASGAVSAASYTGVGTGLTALNASNISNGTLNDGRLSSNVALLNAGQAFTALTSFTAGLTLGNTSDTTAGNLRWTGTDFEGYDGTQWKSLTVGVSPIAGINSFYAYDAAGGIDISAGWTNVTLDSEVKEDSDYTHATDSEEVTINTDGWYEITYTIGTINVSGNTRSGSEAKLQTDSGGGYADIPGSLGAMYNRQASEGENSTSATVVRQFTAGDKIKIQARVYSGGNVLTLANSTSLAIKRFAELGSGGGGGGTSFIQNGNAFGSGAILGTTDNFGLNFITNTVTQFTIDTNGNANLTNGSLSTNGTTRLTNAGALQNITGLTIISGGANITGGINNNAGGITNTGALSGVTSITASGAVSAASFTGVGTGLTALNATNITSGTLTDNRLTSNVALLDAAQTFTGLKTFSSLSSFNGALKLGTTADTSAGNIRWTGTDFEGYDGSTWKSFTSGGGGGGTSFIQNGNSFGVPAVLGTTDANGLSFITDSISRFTIDSSGNANLVNGSLSTAGTVRLTNAGALQNISSITASGAVSAGSFTGVGTGLTALNASNISGGTLSDARLSGNVALLNGTQTFSGSNTFSSGLTIGNTASAAAGRLRWTGTDFEGYDGSTWKSLTSGGGLTGSGNVYSIVKAANEVVTSSTTLQNDDHLFFPIAANEKWTFRFVLYANASTLGDIKFAVTAPSGATCSVGVIDAEGAVTTGNIGCGISSGIITGNGAVDTYEITGSVVNGATAGTVRLQWAQNTSSVTAATVFSGSYMNAIPESAVIGGGGPTDAFVQNGNNFGATAILGTTDANSLSFVTGGISRAAIDTSGNLNITGGSLSTNGTTRLTNAGALQNITGLTIISGGANITGGINNNAGGITNTGALSGVTSITASGEVSAASFTGVGTGLTALNATNITSGTLTDNRLTSNVALLDAAQTFTGLKTFSNTLTISSGGLSATGNSTINGTLSGLTGYSQASGNFAISGAGTFNTGSGTVNLNGAVNAATTIYVNDGLSVSGTNGIVNSKLYVEGGLSIPTVGVLPTVNYGAYTFDADGDSDEAAWTFVSDNGTNGLNPANTARAWSHDTNDTTSADVGPTSGQGGSPDGYVYTEASSPAVAADTFHMTLNENLDASVYDWDISFYWNQRGNDNLATVEVQTNEAGGGWVTRGTYGSGGPDVATGGTDVWNFESLDLSSSISNASTQVRLLVTLGSSGNVWNNDFGIDTVAVSGTPPPASYSDNIFEAYNKSNVGGVDLLVLRSDVGSVGDVKFRVDSNGDVFADGVNNIGGGADLAEKYKNNDGAKPGDVVYFTDNRTVAKTKEVGQKGLAGIVSTYAGIVLDANTQGIPIALSGRAPVKFSVENGTIERGDYLTSGPNGVAVKATGAGPVIGTAMQAAAENGMVDVFVSIGYYSPDSIDGIFEDNGSGLITLSGNFSANGIGTNGTIRLSNEGKLENITGLSLVGGGASIVGGVDNNNDGIVNAGSIDGVTTLSAQNIRLTGSDGNNLLELTKDNTGVFTVFESGALELKLSSDKAFAVKDNTGDDIFSVNTAGGLVRIGSDNNTAGVLLVLDNVALDGDPVGVNGAQYYNTNLDKFRCFENNVWVDCISSVGSEFLVASKTFSNTTPTEQEISTQQRAWVDLSGAASYRIIVDVEALAGTPQCKLQFTDNPGASNWQSLTGAQNVGTLALGATGSQKSDWFDLTNTAKQDVMIRVLCGGGSSENPTVITGVRLQLR